ncbi:E3 SUMO-protein ligase NSE2-like [Pectinophora gossypiella]|uniref:E3 SUMO-protein ligase NSE2 n=1 Tax=Pectinophora gossypiella TaxID=13191 RepID=A0A1E1WPD2_PECGO|nr:E3 SUMO-protein ligase NSE2-like [Pectinophora gossypiella]
MADSDLADLRKQCISSLYLCADNVSKYLEEEKDAQFSKLRSYVSGYCMMEAQQDVAIRALEKTTNETNESNVDTLEDRFNEHLSSLAKKKLKVDNHPYMKEFDSRVQKGMQQARQNLDESDLAITESHDQYIDPITKKPISDPVKNKICGHIYEKESIYKFISLKNRIKCPVVGCANTQHIQHQHLLSDEELKFRMTLTQHSTMIQERTILDLDESVQ